MATGLFYQVIGITHTPDDRSSTIVMDVFLLFMAMVLAIEGKNSPP